MEGWATCLGEVGVGTWPAWDPGPDCMAGIQLVASESPVSSP